MNAERIRWQSAISQVRTELRVFNALRGSKFSQSTSSLQEENGNEVEMQDMKNKNKK